MNLYNESNQADCVQYYTSKPLLCYHKNLLNKKSLIYDFKKNDVINVTIPTPITNSLLSIRNSKTDKTSPRKIIWIPINLNNCLLIT